MNDPLLPHLLDIASDPASDGLILAGGYGIRLKQAFLREIGARTLIAGIPEARATQDLDFFLLLSLFIERERGAAVRALLDRLNYAELAPRYQFHKPVGPGGAGLSVKVNLLARLPSAASDIRVNPPRVGAGAGIGLHGRETPEGFAVEDGPLRVPARGKRSDGEHVVTDVRVLTTFAWLNLKVKAGHDWLRMQRGEIDRKRNSEKHVFDVYILTAMLTESELADAADLAERYRDHPEAINIRRCATDLFETINSPGIAEAGRQAATTIDYALFWEGLRQALGID